MCPYLAPLFCSIGIHSWSFGQMAVFQSGDIVLYRDCRQCIDCHRRESLIIEKLWWYEGYYPNEIN